MVIGPDVTCEMRADQADEVDALLRAAFPGPEEAELVRALRRDGAMWAEFVQPWAGKVGAYAAISRMVAPQGWGALAPDGGQRNFWRFGTRIVSMIAQSVNLGIGRIESPRTLVVLGEPAFYERCTFCRSRAARLRSAYPLSHLMIARPGDDIPEETLIYPAAFESV